jgi:hypothetical protein
MTQHRFHSRIQLPPSQQQLENNPNQKSKKTLKQGWDGNTSKPTIPTKKENRKCAGLRLFFKKQSSKLD